MARSRKCPSHKGYTGKDYPWASECNGCWRFYNLVNNPKIDYDAVVKRFFAKFDIGEGCWEWKAVRNHKGYGQFKYKGQMCQAHRVSYELLVGVIPSFMDIDHVCCNRGCIRPDHLQPLRPAENSDRAYRLIWGGYDE